MARRLTRRSTPLHEAAGYGHAGEVAALLESGADLAAKDRTGETPLHWAVRSGHVEIAAALIAAGADPHTGSEWARKVPPRMIGPCQKPGQTPLHTAAIHGHVEVVAMLLAAGVDPDAEDNAECRPLHYAAMKGHAGVVDALLAAGADPDAESGGGDRPLHYAIPHDWTREALELGFDPPDLCLASHTEIVAALLAGGADPNATEEHDFSPLYLAARSGRVEIAAALLAAGADPNYMGTALEKTPLHVAAEEGHTEVVAVLLAAGADPNAKDGDGAPPVRGAIRYGHAETAAVLGRRVRG